MSAPDDALPWPVFWRRSTRARRVSLRIDPIERRVIVTCPPSIALKRAKAFLAQHRSWIDEKLAALPDALSLAPGSNLVLNDQSLVLSHAPEQRRPASLDGDRLIIGGPIERFEARAVCFLRQIAGMTLPEQLRRHAASMACTPSSIVCSAARTRWGSCTRTGKIMLNWRLVLMPATVRDYVIIHELAHLIHFDHSQAFWQHVERFHPERREAQNWLRHHGTRLLSLG
ncbi:M48 family metallopeptidase [Asaia astilbis]